jgi:hypothetical protein
MLTLWSRGSLAASCIKLRCFGPGGKSDPGEYVAAAKQRFPGLRRKIDKYKYQLFDPPRPCDPGFLQYRALCGAADDHYMIVV